MGVWWFKAHLRWAACVDISKHKTFNRRETKKWGLPGVRAHLQWGWVSLVRTPHRAPLSSSTSSCFARCLEISSAYSFAYDTNDALELRALVTRALVTNSTRDALHDPIGLRFIVVLLPSYHIGAIAPAPSSYLLQFRQQSIMQSDLQRVHPNAVRSDSGHLCS